MLSYPGKLIRGEIMRKYLAKAVAVLLAAAALLPCRVQALSAQKAILVDGTTGRALQEKDADAQSLIASTTKIMTALIVCEQCNVLDRVAVPKEAVGIEGSSMYLQEGEVLTIQELLYGLMLSSGNDAATALAIYCGGTVEGFAGLMNDKARELGLNNTHFVNPHGLDAPGHYATARDLATLAVYAMKNPVFARTVSAKTVTVGQRYLRNHNKLLWQYPDANGVKTGYTKAAGRILVSGACRNGRQLVAVTINAPDDWNDHAYLLDRGFEQYSIRKILAEGQRVAVAEVAGGAAGEVELLAAEDFVYPLAAGEKISFELPGLGFLYAPVACGQSAGFLHIMVDGQPVGKVELLFGNTVERQTEEKKGFFEKLFGG